MSGIIDINPLKAHFVNEETFEMLFCRDGIITQKEIPLGEVWEI